MDAGERRKWLMAMSEMDSFNLPVGDWYDRIRFLREELGRSAINMVKVVHREPQNQKASPRAYNGSKTIFRDWMRD